MLHCWTSEMVLKKSPVRPLDFTFHPDSFKGYQTIWTRTGCVLWCETDESLSCSHYNIFYIIMAVIFEDPLHKRHSFYLYPNQAQDTVLNISAKKKGKCSLANNDSGSQRLIKSFFPEKTGVYWWWSRIAWNEMTMNTKFTWLFHNGF